MTASQHNSRDDTILQCIMAISTAPISPTIHVTIAPGRRISGDDDDTFNRVMVAAGRRITWQQQ